MPEEHNAATSTTEHAGQCVGLQPREVTVTVDRISQRTVMEPRTVMEQRTEMVPETETVTEKVMVPKPVEKIRMREVVNMVEERYTETEMVEEVVQRQVPKMVERTVQVEIMVPQVVNKTIMVKKMVQETIMVPKMETKTVKEVSKIPKTVTVPRTEMHPKCVQDHYQETRVLRFDPLTGEQIGEGSPIRHASPVHSTWTSGSPQRAGISLQQMRPMSSPSTKRPPSVPSGGHRHSIGQQARVRYIDGQVYDATIRTQARNGTYGIEWYDGTLSEHVSDADIQDTL